MKVCIVADRGMISDEMLEFLNVFISFSPWYIKDI